MDLEDFEIEINNDVPADIVWVDVETLGLNERTHPMIEIGAIVTDKYGRERSRFSSVIGYSKNFILPKMSPDALDPVVYKMHTKNGLFEEVEAASGLVDRGHTKWRRTVVEDRLLSWLETVTMGGNQGKSYSMAGASVHYDRRFMAAQMPRLESWFHYRNYDVSTILGLAAYSGRLCSYEKRNIHRVLPDIEDEIAVQNWAMLSLVA